MSARNAAKYQRLEGRSNYPREWQTQLVSAPAASPLYCCYATFCCYCASFQQRKQILYGDMSRYICCAGAWPCAGRMGEQKCPDFCLGLEVVLCFPQSVASNRWALQDELRIMNTPFDNCVIGTMIAAQYLACVCSIAACLSGSDEINELAQVLDCVADILWCSVCGCLLTQQHVEVAARDAAGGALAYGASQQQGAMHAPVQQQIAMGVPPPQQQHAGYPPQYGAAPAGYPQMQR